jgi:succinate dehydrogenase cytochrome b subunit
MSTVKTTLTGYLRYQGRQGHWSFLLHRVTGLGTLLFLTIHILDTATVYLAPTLYQDVINIYRSTIFGLGEIALVFCVLFHGVNGLRIAFYDLFAPKQWVIPTQQKAILYELVVTLLIWIPAAAIMVRNLLVHNFGLLGG